MTAGSGTGRPLARPEDGRLRRDGLTPGRLEYRIWRCLEDGGILEHRVVRHAPLDLEAFRIAADDADSGADVTVASLGRFESLHDALRSLPELADVGPDSTDTAVAVGPSGFALVARTLDGWADSVELNGWEVEPVAGGWFPREGYEEVAVALADGGYPGGDRATFLLGCEDLYAVLVEGNAPQLLAAQTAEDALADFLANHVEEGDEVRSDLLPGDRDEDDDEDLEDDEPIEP